MTRQSKYTFASGRALAALLAVLAGLMLIAAACGSGDGDDTEAAESEESDTDAAEAESEEPDTEDSESEAEESDDAESEPEESGEAGGDLGSQDTITLAIGPWNGSAVNVAVAEQLLESEFGYTVETVDIDENATWSAINNGDIDAALEVWPSGHADNIVDFIENGGVENAGELGPIGKIGWYIPTYMVDENPELATWEGFTDPELAGLFATAETGDAGQFLGGDPSFVQYDEDIIANLELPLEVVYAGSEEAILAAIDASYSREDPVLAYLWTPHSAHNTYDLTEVALPEYSDECYEGAGDGGVDCDYPADVLFKIVGENLADAAPAADAFIRSMNYTTEDQIEMLAAVEVDGMSIEDAAAAWIEAHPDTWKAWL